jgi:DNA-binding CsgD family transcriptional regulator
MTARAATSVRRPQADAGVRVLELSYQLSSLADRASFLTAAATELVQTFGGEVVSWNDVLVAAHRFDFVVHPQTPETAMMMAALAPLAGVHPVVRSFMADGRRTAPVPRRVSDVTTADEWHRSPVFQEPFRGLGLEHQLGIVVDVRAGQLLRGWAVVRSGRDFTDGQMGLAWQLQPLLVVLDRMYAAPCGPHTGEAVGRYRLTPRELDVLRLLGMDCTARQIASGLRISERTVHKHLENLYAKLGCRDRLGAVLATREAGLPFTP